MMLIRVWNGLLVNRAKGILLAIMGLVWQIKNQVGFVLEREIVLIIALLILFVLVLLADVQTIAAK